MKKQTGSAHVVIVVILIVALLGALGFIFWQNFINKSETNKNTKSETAKVAEGKKQATEAKKDVYADWLSYKSTRDGYEIKYPKNWITVPESNDDGLYIRNFDPNPKPSGDTNYPQGYINVRVLLTKNDDNFEGSTGFSTTEWYAKLGNSEVRNGPVTYAPTDVKATTVNGLAAKSAKSVFSEINENIFFMKGDELYNINLYPYAISSDQTVRLIIDSFEFI